MPLSVGEPLKLVVEGKNRLERNDILVGEVWLCSGQSNMEWPVTVSTNADLEIAAANHPQIRFVRVKGPGSQTPVEDFEGEWEVCTPESVAGFSAVGYFFGRELQRATRCADRPDRRLVGRLGVRRLDSPRPAGRQSAVRSAA